MTMSYESEIKQTKPKRFSQLEPILVFAHKETDMQLANQLAFVLADLLKCYHHAIGVCARDSTCHAGSARFCSEV
jgi:hypothetical protein